MTSPRVAALPSLPAFDKSMAERVNESAKTGVLAAVALMRGPVEAPQAELLGAAATGAAEAREGKASSDSVSNGIEGGALGLEVVAG